MKKSVIKAKELYLKYERHLSSFGLIAGFVFDAFTLRRVDLPMENIWIVFRLIGGALGVFLLTVFDKKKGSDVTQLSEREKDIHFLLLFITQFMFGGLLGTYIVFYFRSATLLSSWPFLLFLFIALLCNEMLRDRYIRMSFQISMLFISIYAFAIYILPVIFHRIGPGIFLVSGLVSLLTLALFLLVVWYVSRERFKTNWKILIWLIGGITALINILYFTNLIPPIPLSLKEGGIYHSISRSSLGDYILEGEPVSEGLVNKALSYFRLYDVYHQIPGQPVYAFSAVFSPTSLNTTVVHNWQYYNESAKKWVTKSRVTLPIVGGRDGGYRTYSYKTNLEEGRWRVDVETTRGQDIGRMKFIVKAQGE